LVFMQLLICGTKFSVANKFVHHLVLILYGMLIMMERKHLTITLQINLGDGQAQYLNNTQEMLQFVDLNLI